MSDTSTHGSGSTIDITFADELKGRRILVVDDNRDAAKFCALALERFGARTEIVYGGQLALKQMHVGAYDVVLLNYMMPDMDGITVARRYREYGGSSPIILTTACSTNELTRRMRGVDVDDTLLAPYMVEDLVSKVRRWIQH